MVLNAAALRLGLGIPRLFLHHLGKEWEVARLLQNREICPIDYNGPKREILCGGVAEYALANQSSKPPAAVDPAGD
jgi:hypothetical protein